ncbi:MAG: elongation factor Ts [Acidimicrobiia bacterium]|nr:elongation factor Ts [Acidimicrobiia bacterium]
MAEISAKQVADLRKATGAGMMDAKKALIEADGDTEKAKEILQVKGLADAKKRADRTTDTGSIGHYLHFQTERPVMGCLVELRCETDFVAKSEEFQDTARDLAMHLAAARPQWVTRDQVPDIAIDEASKLFAAQAAEQGKPPEVVEKIVAGKLGSFYSDNVLYEQEFVNPQKFEGTVEAMLEHLTARLGEKITVGAIARVALGEN